MSDDTMPPEVASAVRQIVRDLVAGNAAGLQPHLGRNRASDLARVMQEYGRRFSDYPDDSSFEASARPMQMDDLRWHVLVDLWTASDGQSDLTLVLNCDWDGSRSPTCEIIDLRVM